MLVLFGLMLGTHLGTSRRALLQGLVAGTCCRDLLQGLVAGTYVADQSPSVCLYFASKF